MKRALRHGPIIVTGGGTGGHVFPAFAIARALLARGRAVDEVIYVGARHGLEARLKDIAPVPVTLLPGRGIVRSLSWESLVAVAGLVVALFRAIRLVQRTHPSAIVTVGGYAGFACSVAGLMFRVPVVVVNIDAVPGAANRIIGRRASVCALAFPGTELPRGVVTGAPVRDEVTSRDRSTISRRTARANQHLPTTGLVVLVTGGSLGARVLNEVALGLGIALRDRRDVVIVHVAGERNIREVEKRLNEASISFSPDGAYRLIGYSDDLPELLVACDLVVCRAGAMTVAELSVIGTPSLLIPLGGAPKDHQRHNAELLERAGGAVVEIEGEQVTARTVKRVLSIIDDREQLESMSAAVAGLGQRDSASRIAELIESHAR